MKRLVSTLAFAALVGFAGCGKNGGGTTVDGAVDGDGNPIGGDGNPGDGVNPTTDGAPDHDAFIPPNCVPGGTQCSDCIDNDNDGHADGFDPECTGAADDDEGSFATGIPGDNMDAVNQDCFFDGNSGAGNDGCNIHVCCLLGAMTRAECPIGANQYNPAECPPPIGTTPLSQMCIDVCSPLTPPGCDCFACCTLCNDTGCYDVITNPSTSPNCDESNLQDPNACKRCTKNTQCGGGECGGTTCTLCPGQDPNSLPDSCGGTTACPTGVTACPMGTGCPQDTYCSSGCCIGIIQ